MLPTTSDEAAAVAPGAVRVLVVDDHEVVREGLSAALSCDGSFEVVAAVATAASAMIAAARACPDVALVDLRLPDTDGALLCRDIRQRYPRTAVVVLSSYVSEDTVRSAMQAGASAYVTKGAGLAELRRAIVRSVADSDAPGESQIVGQLHDLVAERAVDGRLTTQQERVLELSAEGLTYREIGVRLFISESTVRFHMQKLKGKFGARTKTELVARAIRTGAMAPATEDVAVPAWSAQASGEQDDLADKRSVFDCAVNLGGSLQRDRVVLWPERTTAD
jgi:DNA-binding NarL/FixJ family response regulator